MLGSQKIELTPFFLRPLLDCEGWDFDIIGDKLLDAIGSTQFLLVPKGFQPDTERRLMHHAKNCFRGY